MINKCIQVFLVISICAIFSFAQEDNSAKTKNINRQFKEITNGKDSKERGMQIREELELIRVKYTYEPFTAKSRSGDELNGWNIIAEIPNPKASKTLMIGAHYDKVTKGIGAVDNASGSIAILQLLKAFKENPLKNHNLKVAFWDLEEKGLIGAGAFVKANMKTLPDVYINFDVYGYGDTLWLWAKDDKASFAKSFGATSKTMKFSSIITNKYPPSDHLVFSPTKVETYSFSLLKKAEIKNLTKLLSQEQLKPEEFPEVIKIIHTDNDNLKKIDVKAIAKSLPIVEVAIRNIDK